MAHSQKKVIISAAITGAIHTPSMSPYFPASPEQISGQAVDAAKAGAAVVHIHARREDGMPVGDHETFRRILTGIKSRCDAVIGITTGGANGMSVEERFSVIEEFQPEMASANGGSMNFCYHKLAKDLAPQYDWELPYLTRTYDNVFKNTFQDMEYCIRAMNRCGTLPEYEVFDYGQLSNLAFFKKEGIITQPIYIQFVPGVMGGFPMSGEGMALISIVPKPAASATAEPLIPANTTLAKILTWPRPPGIQPTRALQKLKILCVMLPTFINFPASRKNGMASNVKLFTPVAIFMATVPISVTPKLPE